LSTDGWTWWNQYTPLQLCCGGYKERGSHLGFAISTKLGTKNKNSSNLYSLYTMSKNLLLVTRVGMSLGCFLTTIYPAVLPIQFGHHYWSDRNFFNWSVVILKDRMFNVSQLQDIRHLAHYDTKVPSSTYRTCHSFTVSLSSVVSEMIFMLSLYTYGYKVITKACLWPNWSVVILKDRMFNVN
jgi:hypothetical protein